MNKSIDFRCDMCDTEADTLYRGWFYTNAADNPWAKGTVSAGVMRKLNVCYNCAKKSGRNPDLVKGESND